MFWDPVKAEWISTVSEADRAWHVENVTFAAENEAADRADAELEARYQSWLHEEAQRLEAQYEAHHFYGVRA